MNKIKPDIMKRHMTIIWVISILLFSNLSNSQAQIRDFGNFIATGNDDAEALFSTYLSPYLNGFGASMSGGWYTTAKTHKPGGFDLSVFVSTTIVPEENRNFNVDDLQLSTLSRISGSANESSTLAGSLDEGPEMEYNYDHFKDSAYTLPPGVGLPIVPAPMIQLGLGLFKGTDIVGRYLPQVGVQDIGKYGFWGIGVRHNIKQWIPILKKTPAVHLAVMAGYTRMNSYVDLDVTPNQIGLQRFANPDEGQWENQRMDAFSNSFTGNLIASVNLPVITIYGGAGFAYSKSNVMLVGDFPVITEAPLNEQQDPVVEAKTDPLSFVVENEDGGFTKSRLNIGVRFKMLKVLAFNVDYTRSTYNVVSVGLGVTFR